MGKIILFDGTSTDKWTTKDGEAIDWFVKDGVMTVNHLDIMTKEQFGDAHFHVEWREPLMPGAEGQEKGNSGVFIQGVYELQVLDSYGVDDFTKCDCGAFYNMFAPLVNACRPTMEWQEYDIYFRAPRFNDAGEVCENARATVFQNGICVQNNIELYRTTPGGTTLDKVARGPLFLQDHHHPVSFRNIWAERLDSDESKNEAR